MNFRSNTGFGHSLKNSLIFLHNLIIEKKNGDKQMSIQYSELKMLHMISKGKISSFNKKISICLDKNEKQMRLKTLECLFAKQAIRIAPEVNQSKTNKLELTDLGKTVYNYYMPIYLKQIGKEHLIDSCLIK